MKRKPEEVVKGLYLALLGIIAVAAAYAGWILDTETALLDWTMFKLTAISLVASMVIIQCIPMEEERKCSGKKRMERRSK